MIEAAFTARLGASGVRSCLIGAVAMAIHGYVRTMVDVDPLSVDVRGLKEVF